MKKSLLKRLYIDQKMSVADIAKQEQCSQNKINYWLTKHQISKRSISEAVYIKNNPSGDPFRVQQPKTNDDWFLLGLGLGLYWGEGTKANKHAVRLGNSDPDLILQFLKFLKQMYQIETSKLSFGLQIFNDISEEKALKYWSGKLKVSTSSFQKVVVTPSRGVGTYRKKSDYGVLTVYFHNTKLRDIIVDALDDLRS